MTVNTKELSERLNAWADEINNPKHFRDRDDLRQAARLIAGMGEPVACVHPDTLNLMRLDRGKWRRVGVEPWSELRAIESYIPLFAPQEGV